MPLPIVSLSHSRFLVNQADSRELAAYAHAPPLSREALDVLAAFVATEVHVVASTAADIALLKRGTKKNETPHLMDTDVRQALDQLGYPVALTTSGGTRLLPPAVKAREALAATPVVETAEAVAEDASASD